MSDDLYMFPPEEYNDIIAISASGVNSTVANRTNNSIKVARCKKSDKALLPVGRHKAKCISITDKKRRNKKDYYLCLTFECDGITITYPTNDLKDLDESTVSYFRSFEGKFAIIDVKHIGIYKKEHKINKITLLDQKNESSHNGDMTFEQISSALIPYTKPINIKAFSCLIKRLSPLQRIKNYYGDGSVKHRKECFRNMLASHNNIVFDGNAGQVTILPERREELISISNDMFMHGSKTGRFDIGQEDCEENTNKIIANLIKGFHGEDSWFDVCNAVFAGFGLDTRLFINYLKYDGFDDGCIDASFGEVTNDVKYRNDVNSRKVGLVARKGFLQSTSHFLIHTHSIRRKDGRDYSDDFYLNVNGSAHTVVVRGGQTGAAFSDKAQMFKNGNFCLDIEDLIPVYDLVLYFAIQVAMQEGYIE